jgi:predicted NBD/HSP70 family sugar kinase
MPTTPRLRPTESRLLALLEVSGPLTRGELARLAGLPPTTISGVAAELLRDGRVVEAEAGPGGGRAGRPPRVLALSAPPGVVALVSLSDGARVTLAGVSGEVLAEWMGPPSASPAELGAEAEAAAGAVLEAVRSAAMPRERLAAAVLSVARPRPGVENVAAFAARVGVPLVVENDANLGALGEAAFGVGRGLDSFVYVMLGKGVGAGLVLGGRLHRGASGFAGELAHVQVRDQEDGALCICGGRGCLARITGPSVRDFVERAYTEQVSVPEVLSLVAGRDPGARRLFADLGRTVGRPLADLCTMLDPAAVVVDGSLGAAGEPIMAGIREAIDRHAAPAVADSVRVLAGELGERAEILGAVAMVRQRTLDRVAAITSQFPLAG